MIRQINLALALLLAAAVTFCLFFLMQLLISVTQEQPQRSERMFIGDITIPEIEIEPQREQPKPVKPEEPETLPDLPQIDERVFVSLENGLPLPRVQPLTGLTDDPSITPADAEYLPIVTVDPQYPPRALQRGIEGWCQVRFTVNENGGVENAEVVDAEPPRVFDRASLQAVARFKFNPRTVDGQPVRTSGVQYVFTYRLED